ncbi:MAG TPA: hypothetical protein VMA74_11525 [Dyella sp.]|uniref:hypothetical protein n=1 Tax=Dyella sp. TaxID=1869338 RepID=UPI002BDF44EA|nr:hypothetical protein [Dyella sp.]HUB90343.1 hypothetical protein [Dyella sp.]
MFNYYKVGALVLALAAVGAAHATQSLKVTIAEPKDSTAKETGVVVFALTNDGDEPVDILKPLTPFAQMPTGRLPGAIFSVKDSRGHRVPYRGDSGKYLNFTKDDFIHLLPGQSVRKTVDLSKDYELSSGPYTISYDQDYSMKRPEQGRIVRDTLDATNSTPRKHSISNTLQIWVNGSLLQAKKLQAKQKPTAGLSPALMISPLTVPVSSCPSDTGQAAQSAVALTNAQNNADDAWSTWENDHFLADSNGSTFSPDTLFT